MNSLIVSTVLFLGLLGLIYTVNYLYYRFSPVHSFPSVTTLSARALFEMFIIGVGYFGTLFCLVFFESELGLSHSGYLYIYLCIGILFLFIAAIVGIFRYDKGVWLRRNPKHSRLLLPSWNEGSKNMGVSISRIDDINYGRHVSFSWFDGCFITAGRHRVAFEYYEHYFTTYRTIRKIIYKKEMVFNFKADTVYVIEVLQERQTFRITADTTRKNYL